MLGDSLTQPIPEINTENTTETNTENTTENSRLNISAELIGGTGVPRAAKSDYEQVIDAWNGNKYLPKVQRIAPNTQRHTMLKTRIKEYGLASVLQAIDNISRSDFLQGLACGAKNTAFLITFDWFVKPNNFPKVLEGNYANKGASNGESTTGEIFRGDGFVVEGGVSDEQQKFEERRKRTMALLDAGIF
jgi:hypothetical protein